MWLSFKYRLILISSKCSQKKKMNVSIIIFLMWLSDKVKRLKKYSCNFAPDLWSQTWNKDRNTKRQMYSLIEMRNKTATRERICSGSWELISSVRLLQITPGWTEWGAVAQVSCYVTVSETGFGNLQRFSAIPLLRPHSPGAICQEESWGRSKLNRVRLVCLFANCVATVALIKSRTGMCLCGEKLCLPSLLQSV